MNQTETSKFEKAISITSTMLDARNTLKALKSPEQYSAIIETYWGYIQQGMTKWNCTSVESALQLLKSVQGSPFSILSILAALVEKAGNE